MHSFDKFHLLVTFLLSLRFGNTIRVDWNTNKGPIIPPTPRTTQRPQPPFREPAPVWEDQSNDIPNPNPYVYVLPPPSRPRLPTNNYLTSDRRPVTQDNYHLYNKQHNYSGQLLPPMPNAANFYQNGNGIGNAPTATVAGLAPKYVPNVGFKYFAIVPNNNNYNNNNGYSNNNYYNNNNNNNDKVQGKYNAKTKKYKAFEKVKYVPPNYYPFYEFALPDETPYVPIFAPEKALLNTQQTPQQQPQQQQEQQEAQQLPAIATERPFNEKPPAVPSSSAAPAHNPTAPTYEIIEKAEEHEAAPAEKSSQNQPSMLLQKQNPAEEPELNTKIALSKKENFGKFPKKYNSYDLQQKATKEKFHDNFQKQQNKFR